MNSENTNRVVWLGPLILCLSAFLLLLSMVVLFWRDRPAQARSYYEAANPLLMQVRVQGCGDERSAALLEQTRNLVWRAIEIEPYEALFWARLALISFCARGSFDAQGYQALDIARSIDPAFRDVHAADLLRSLSSFAPRRAKAKDAR